MVPRSSELMHIVVGLVIVLLGSYVFSQLAADAYHGAEKVLMLLMGW